MSRDQSLPWQGECIFFYGFGPSSAMREVQSGYGTHRPRTAEVVIYVDLDGVLQSQHVMHHPKRGIYLCPNNAPGRALFEWAHHLVEVLEPFPQVRYVLSSSWCVWPGYGRTLKRMPQELRWRFIGGTYHKRVFGRDLWSKASFQDKPRWLQIYEDVRRRKPRHWLALDDDTERWPDWMNEHLIACDGDLGLSCERTRALLVERLRSVSPGLDAAG